MRCSACASSPLDIVCRAWWHVPHIDCFQGTNVNTHLECSRAAQCIDFVINKGLLVECLMVFRQLRSMFFNLQRLHLRTLIEISIMIAFNDFIRRNLFKRTTALDEGT